MSGRVKLFAPVAIVVVVVLALVGAALVHARSPEVVPAAGPVAVAEQARVQQDGAYLQQVRSSLPGLAGVSDAQLHHAAQFTCATYGDMGRIESTPAEVEQAAQGLMRYGYVPAGDRADAWQLAMMSGGTC